MTTIPAAVYITAQGNPLDHLVARRAATPFAWGVHDCAMWAFDAVRAVTGRDPAPDLRGAYATARQAMRLLQRMGGLQGLATARLGPPRALQGAPCGAVVLLAQQACEGPAHQCGAFGVVWRGLVLAQGAQSLVVVPPGAVQHCWGPQ
jgi:hypothetical protein